jgi:hypothetical protein
MKAPAIKASSAYAGRSGVTLTPPILRPFPERPATPRTHPRTPGAAGVQPLVNNIEMPTVKALGGTKRLAAYRGGAPGAAPSRAGSSRRLLFRVLRSFVVLPEVLPRDRGDEHCPKCREHKDGPRPKAVVLPSEERGQPCGEKEEEIDERRGRLDPPPQALALKIH